MRTSICLPFAMAFVVATAQAASTDDLQAFVTHPSHCATLVGSDAHENDQVTPEFAQAVADLLPVVGTPDNLSVHCVRQNGSNE